jgi:adenosylmethionine-8-amino-7-oxononanoate aminotransferase
MDPARRRALEEADDRFLWHPFTPHSVYRAEEPLLIEAGEGHSLIDTEGRRYFDGVGSLWCNVLGHRHPHLDRALRRQLDRIAHSTLLGHSNVVAVELAARLAELAPPGLTKVFFSDNGSTAVEIAVKMALQHAQQTPGRERRTRFVSFAEAYHGDTIGAVSVGGVDLFHARFKPLLFDVLRLPSPACGRCPEAADPCCGRVERAFAELLERQGEEIAAVVVEPGFQGAAGILTQPPGFVSRIVELARAAGVLVIFDEVASGMGRSGELFCATTLGVTPDLLCIAKGLTGGYLPLAATLATEGIFESFLGPPELGRTFFHGHTYTGNALGAAVALAALDILADPPFLAGVKERAEELARRLETLRSSPLVGEVRSFGLAAGIDLWRDAAAREPFRPGDRAGIRVCRRARERGVFLRPLGDTLVLMPPLSTTSDELSMLVEAVDHALREEQQALSGDHP